ncbi:hypothetical protein BJY01DRAFT_254581 [Aspergillus pseudoustus]|uniref:Uncharacterized protein n=1 Tax=Aspergillus pseudoustus TaxID=1810923 RepID=A0ABR4IS95_9EURO
MLSKPSVTLIPDASQRWFLHRTQDLSVQIWLDIAYPEHESETLHTLDTYLPILKASGILEDEIHYLLFGRSVLVVSLTSKVRLIFSRDHNKRSRLEQGYSFLQIELISLSSTYSDSGLGAFPWGLLGIKLGAIPPGNTHAAFELWVQIRDVVGQFKSVWLLPRLVIRLERSEDWFLQENLDYDFNYRFFIRAFSQLRDSASTVEVRSDSSVDNPEICWESMSSIFGSHLEIPSAARDPAATDEEPSSEQTSGNDKGRQLQLAQDWYIMCLKAARPGRNLGPSAGSLIYLWCTQCAGGQLEFEEHFHYLLDNCPEFICKVDSTLSLLTKIRHSLNYSEGPRGDEDVRSSLSLQKLSEAMGDATLKFWRMYNANRKGQTVCVIR